MWIKGSVWAAFVLWGGAVAADPLVIFAAASLKEPMDAVAAEFGDAVVSYGGSGTLARQIQSGAPADVVVLAHPHWMDALDGLTHDRVDVFGNMLVVIGPAGPPLALTSDAVLDALGADGRLAVGLTNAVPAGQYAAQALTSLGLWDSLQPRLAEVENVRAALMLVVRQETPLGIVYATDALADPRVTVRATIPADHHAPIVYPAARISDDPRAIAFLALLTGDVGRDIFESAGFTVLAAR